MTRPTPDRSYRPRLIWLMLMLVVSLTATTLAVKPKTWDHSTESDFEPGEVDQTVVTNLGDIKLASATKTIDALPKGVTIVYDLLKTDKTTYLAAGPEGRLLTLNGETVNQLARPEDSQVFTLARHQDTLLVGLSGPRARLARLTHDKSDAKADAQQTQPDQTQNDGQAGQDQADQAGQAGQADKASDDNNDRGEQGAGQKPTANLQTISTLPESAKYIWDILVTDNAVYLATGPEGVIYRLPLGPHGQLKAQPHAPAQPESNQAASSENQAKAKDQAQEAKDLDQAKTQADGEADKAENKAQDKQASPDDNQKKQQANEGDTPDKENAQNDPGDSGGSGDSDGSGDPRLTTVLDTAQANVLCLGQDGKGRIYAGTDTAGLIYRITQGSDQADQAADGQPGYEAYVIYDAAEPEIGAMLVREDGTVYAGTADAEQARPGRLEPAQDEEAGRPEDSSTKTGKPDVAEDQPEPMSSDSGQAQPRAQPAQANTDKQSAKTDQTPGQGSDQTPPDESGQKDQSKDKQNTDSEKDSDQPQTNDQPAEPTQQQRDRLREIVRKKLQKARESGELGSVTQQGSQNKPRPTQAAAAPTGEKEGGNAVYRINPRGFVTELFRESVMVLDLAAVNKSGKDGIRLLAATGPEGQVFRIDPKTGETGVVTDLDSQQVSAISVDPAKPDRIMLGSANPAKLLTLQPGTANHGTYTSKVLDSEHISLWGGLNLTAKLPKGASVKVETRSGNVADPKLAAWSKWSDSGTVKAKPDRSDLRPHQIEVGSPPARFLQYRLTLNADQQAKRGPVVNRLKLAYVYPNQKPAIKSLKAEYPETKDDKPPPTEMKIEWEATDPNGDRLTYDLEYQPAGSDKWLTAAENLTQTNHKWKTDRVPNGYYRLRVTAADRLDNPGDMAQTVARTSDAVLVDNAPPSLDQPGQLTPEKPLQKNQLTITGKASDNLSTIKQIAYTLDDEDAYTPILPRDLIYDSTTEQFDVTIPSLKPGPHVLTLKITDARGNTTRHNVVFSVGDQ